MQKRSPDAESPQAEVHTDAFLGLLLENRHRLYAFIAKQLVNPADVEDVFQKTSIVLWKKIGTFDREGSFFHWACGIAFNEVRNFLTVQRRNRLHFDGELLDLIAEEAQAEADLSEARLQALRNCMKAMPERQREILQRCYAGAESITDVAAKLGRERSALYKQLARLKSKVLACIRTRLSEQGTE